MDTLEIDHILARNPVTRKLYMGTFPSDRLPRCRKYPCAMVANFDDHTEPGTHWVAIFAKNNEEVYYFDSLGGQTEVDNIEEYLRKNFLVTTHQLHAFQKAGSTVCGQYAIFFIYMSANKVPFIQIQRILRRTRDPDNFVSRFVSRFVQNV